MPDVADWGNMAIHELCRMETSVTTCLGTEETLLASSTAQLAKNLKPYIVDCRGNPPLQVWPETRPPRPDTKL